MPYQYNLYPYFYTYLKNHIVEIIKIEIIDIANIKVTERHNLKLIL